MLKSTVFFIITSILPLPLAAQAAQIVCSLTSPFLVNVYLNEFNQYMAEYQNALTTMKSVNGHPITTVSKARNKTSEI